MSIKALLKKQTVCKLNEVEIIAVTKHEIHYCLKFERDTYRHQAGELDDEMCFILKR